MFVNCNVDHRVCRVNGRLTTDKNEKSIFLTCHRHEIYRVQAIGLKCFSYTSKIEIF